MDKNFTILKTKRNKEKLIYNNHEYNSDKRKESRETRRCVNRKCKGRVSLCFASNEISTLQDHNHLPLEFKIKKLLFNKEIIEYSENTEYSSSEIYDKIITNLSKKDCMLLNRKSVYKLIDNRRKRVIKQ
ncbi:hypothetical protein DMUE_4291 [Dictyocoela muelleri]|nr:hypothetical protein DMUE_4291 [Dictyocoela muelleri]